MFNGSLKSIAFRKKTGPDLQSVNVIQSMDENFFLDYLYKTSDKT